MGARTCCSPPGLVVCSVHPSVHYEYIINFSTRAFQAFHKCATHGGGRSTVVIAMRLHERGADRDWQREGWGFAPGGVRVHGLFLQLFCWVGVWVWKFGVLVVGRRCQHLFEVLKRTTSLSYFQILDGNYAIPAFLISFHLGGKKLNNSRIYRPSLYLSLHYDYKIL